MSEPSDRRYDDAPMRERLVRLETIAAEIPTVRQRLHDMATALAVLQDSAERAEHHHGQVIAELQALRREAQDAMRMHDARDDERFERLGSEVSLLKVHAGRSDGEAAQLERHESHKLSRRDAIHAALIGLGAAIAASIVLVVAEALLNWIAGRG